MTLPKGLANVVVALTNLGYRMNSVETSRTAGLFHWYVVLDRGRCVVSADDSCEQGASPVYGRLTLRCRSTERERLENVRGP